MGCDPDGKKGASSVDVAEIALSRHFFHNPRQVCYHLVNLSHLGPLAMMILNLFTYWRHSGHAGVGLFLGLCLFGSVLAPGARSQSAEPSRVFPPDRPEQAAVETDAVAVKGEPTLASRTKPLRVDVDLVLLPVTVTDELNHPIMGLQRQDFAIYDENEQQQIQYFSADDAPISIGLILDLSKSMTNKVDTERAAVAEFFQNANPQDDYFVIAVSGRPKLIADSTRSIDTIESDIGLETPDGNTALLDAIYLGVAKLRSAQYQRKALLIISDGGDNNSRYRLKEIKSILQESDVQAYALGIFDTTLFKTFEEFMGKKWLEEITNATGGRTVTVDNLTKLPEIAAAVSWELRNQYTLGYKPKNIGGNGKWRKIKVRVIRPPGASRLQAYYKKGYQGIRE
jgi:Ca-activated chloride channel family protein